MKRGVISVTIISGLLFCFIMVSVSLSPFPNPDEFNSLGMWINIMFFLFFYILSLILYVVGVKAMKYVMAVFCGMGLLISLSIISLALIMSSVTNNISGFLGLIILCIMASIANVVWYIVAFSKKQINDVFD